MQWYEPAKNESDCKAHAIKLSLGNPGQYITVCVDFGVAGFSIDKRLNVFAPSDSTYSWYALNGKIKQFTGPQRIADQNATPMLY